MYIYQDWLAIKKTSPFRKVPIHFVCRLTPFIRNPAPIQFLYTVSRMTDGNRDMSMRIGTYGIPYECNESEMKVRGKTRLGYHPHLDPLSSRERKCITLNILTSTNLHKFASIFRVPGSTGVPACALYLISASISVTKY